MSAKDCEGYDFITVISSAYLFDNNILYYLIHLRFPEASVIPAKGILGKGAIGNT